MILFSSLLILFALTNVQGCFDEKVETCVEQLMSAVLGDATEEEACKELDKAIQCMKSAAEECGSVEDEAVEGLAELDQIYEKNCAAGKSGKPHSEMIQCMDANKDYIYECMFEGTEKTFQQAMERNVQDRDIISCAMFHEIANCFVRRVGEKCGNEAAQLAEDMLIQEMPEEIEESCRKAGSILRSIENNNTEPLVELLEEFKKKK